MRTKARLYRDQLTYLLIREDLMNSRIRNRYGLPNYSRIYEITLKIAGYQKKEITDNLIDWYNQQIKQASGLRFPIEPKEVENLANRIYAELKFKFITRS